MRAEVFVDTNVFLYSIDEDPASAEKREAAQALLLSERWGWSLQVAAEFYVNATSPKRPFRLESADAKALIETWLCYPTLSVTPDLLRAAIVVQQRFQLSYWDAAIIAAGRELGCGIVYSEDLNHGQEYDGIRVVNPFLAAQSPPG
jgi:predicted nucleic acid-binding protein